MPTPTPAASEAAAPSSLTSLIHNAALNADSPVSPEALSTKEVSSYIRSLSNFSLSDLRNQPQQLRAKSDALHQQLSELCISQTDAFIDIHHAEQQFVPSLATLSTHLAHLIHNSLPELQRAADAFVTASQPVLAERKRIQNVADQFERGHLSDLLEIPSLVHTCVKADHHSEAIQLSEHLIALLTRSDRHTLPPAKRDSSTSASHIQHGQRSTYLSLLIETLSHLARMKADIVASFSNTGLKLPAARKSVNVLRKLNNVQSLLPRVPGWNSVVVSTQSHALVPELGLSENQLCLAFLKARIRSFQSALDAMGSPSSFSSEAYLRRYIDLWREEMADTLGMAFSLFVDEAPSSQQEPSTAFGGSREEAMITPAYLVSSFATSGLERLRHLVSSQLLAAAQRVNPASSTSSDSTSALETLAQMYRNVHTQLSYASASLTRFGFDFGKLLFAPSAIPTSNTDVSSASLSTIESAWLDALSRCLDDAFSYMHEQLDHHLQAKRASLPSRWLVCTQLPSSAIQDLYSISSSNSDAPTYDDLTRANIELVDYPPLAKLLNRLMAWINALQVFAPISLSTVLLQQLDKHFANITNRLLTQILESVSTLDIDPAHAQHLFADDEAQSLLHHLDDESERRALQIELVTDRESVILAKVVKIWYTSVVSWTLEIVRTQIFDLDTKGVQASRAEEVESVWRKAQEWITSTQVRIGESNLRRQHAANQRKKAVEEANARAEEEARIREEQEARKKAEDEARRIKAEAQARAEAEAAKAKEEAEAKLKAEAEAEARLKAEAEARLKAETEARLKAETEARLKAEAEAEAKLKAEAEAKLKAEAEAEARLKAEAEAEAKLKAEAEAKLKAEAEAEARLKTDEQATRASHAEASAEDSVQDQEPPAASATQKKFSLAEKLRQRKEERDRAAAAAAAAAAAVAATVSVETTEAPVDQAGTNTAPAPQIDSSSSDADAVEAAGDDTANKEDGSKVLVEEEALTQDQDEEAIAPVSEAPKPAMDAEDAVDEGENDDDEGDGEGVGEEEGSGANTPTTAVAPTAPNLGGGGGKKKRKNKKKKK